MADIVICGAGMAGVATAYYLAVKHGLTDVVLVDKRAPLTLTSDKSVEGYRNWWPDRLMVDFMNRSIDLMEGIALGSENAIQLNRRGYAYVTSETQAASQFESNARRYADELGLGPLRVHGGAGGASEDVYQPCRWRASGV